MYTSILKCGKCRNIKRHAAEGQEEKMYLNHAHGRQNWIIADVYIIQECMNYIYNYVESIRRMYAEFNIVIK